VPLRTLLPGRVVRGRYELVGLYRGTRAVLRFAPAGATFWGVDVDPKGSLVFGSDIASGLWILRPTT
jgi:hypothetical protein